MNSFALITSSLDRINCLGKLAIPSCILRCEKVMFDWTSQKRSNVVPILLDSFNEKLLISLPVKLKRVGKYVESLIVGILFNRCSPL